ncbi:hypothetical protein DFJ77DRAFT_509654 [Powellomyces hirtus]|nr:hypothetical protein DFJ77DRAFT_509654 [Powellomyces hirtus]
MVAFKAFLVASLVSSAAALPAGQTALNNITNTTNLPGWADVQKAWAAVQKVDTGNDVWNRLAEMTDNFGPRLTGSAGYLKSLKWLSAQMKADKLTVFEQPVENVPTWTRGYEKLTLTSLPNRPNLNIPVIGLGNSYPTPLRGISGEVVAVSSLEALNTTSIKGKIALVNYSWSSYGRGSRIRSQAAVTAEKLGAKAVLIRSVTGYSQETLHTGFSTRAGLFREINSIPAAAISAEDANFLHRLYNNSLINPTKYRAPKIQLNLQSIYKNATTYNIFATLPGATRPEDVILIGGHFDSWDVGVGAGDDAANVFAAWEAIRLIQKSGIKLKRSIRVTGWANEESGSQGADKYVAYVQAENAKTDGERHIFDIESDFGIATPVGLSVEINTPAGAKAADALEAAAANDPTIVQLGWGNIQRGGQGASGADIARLGVLGIPVAGLITTEDNSYFNYHHSPADRMDVVDPKELFDVSRAFAFWAIVASELETPLGQI